MDSADEYLTVTGTSTGEYKEKGSKFFGYAYPATTEEEVSEHLQAIRKIHHTARHVCYAWVLGPKGDQYRANDDGEPSNSAGKPILAQIQGHNLTNTLVAVVRYFGGTKLGVGGLMQAYKTAAKESLEANNFVQRYVTVSVTLRFDYQQQPAVNRILKTHGLTPIHQQFGQDCRFTIEIRASLVTAVQQQMELIPNLDWL